jgi:hypothetical protein
MPAVWLLWSGALGCPAAAHPAGTALAAATVGSMSSRCPPHDMAPAQAGPNRSPALLPLLLLLLRPGPNTGGKTAALKALGLAAVAARCGLPVPAAAPARLPCFDAVLADIGEGPGGGGGGGRIGLWCVLWGGGGGAGGGGGGGPPPPPAPPAPGGALLGGGGGGGGGGGDELVYGELSGGRMSAGMRGELHPALSLCPPPHTHPPTHPPGATHPHPPCNTHAPLPLAAGDEQSLSASLSTFSGHLRRISALRLESGSRSLVLLDEVGTGGFRVLSASSIQPGASWHRRHA